MDKLGIYIHIPFCISKCFYCDFNSYSGMDNKFEPYKNALINEIKNSDLQNYEIDTIFFGGGTPTVFPSCFISEILDALFKNNVSKQAEITVEANPETIADKQKLIKLLQSGTNRLSMGLQTLNDDLLKSLGRIHNSQTFLKSYNLARDVGFENINVDLMLSLPNQTIDDVFVTLEKVVSLAPTHISAYSLIIEENTPFGRLHKNGNLLETSEQLDREMYYLTKDYLNNNNYFHYEISNFAKINCKEETNICKHNLIYWQRKNYLGFGFSAHSFINGTRFNNTDNLNKYLNANGNTDLIRENILTVPKQEAIEETVFLGLRMLKGINLSDFHKEFNLDFLQLFSKTVNKFINQGYLKINDGWISLADKGIDVSNTIFAEVLSDKQVIKHAD